MLDEEAFEPTVTLSQNMDNVAITLIPEQQQVLDIVKHLALYSKMLIAVTGPHGSGKTTLAHELLHSSNHQEDILIIDATIMLGVPAILRRLGDVIQQPIPENRTMAIELLRVQAEQRASIGRSLIIMIDQAEQLDADTINELAEVALQIPDGFAIVLFGLSGYEDNLLAAANQAPIHIQKIQPLSEYGAQLLLQQVYSPGQPLPLSEQEFFSIYQKSKGVVGALLSLASDLFLSTTERATPKAKKAKAKTTLKEYFPVTHLFALLFLLVALLLSYLYNPSKSTEKPTDTKQLESIDVLRGMPLPQENTAADSNFFEDETVAVDAPDILTLDEPQAPTEKLVEKQVNSESVNKQVDLIEQEKPQLQTKSAVKAEATPANKLDADKLLSIKKGTVVQLFGSYEQTNAEKFKQDWQKQLSDTLYIYQTTNKGKPWFVVVVGTYTDKDTAGKAIKTWPAELQKASPWIRDIKAVQAILN